jgi:outer membrane protein W
MKRIILIVSLITGFSVTASAQFRLNAYGAYTFDDGIKSYNSATNYYEGTVEGGFQWGIGAEYMIGENIGIDFKYLHQGSKAPFTYYNNGVKNKTFDLDINYYLFGGSYYFKLANEKIEPYLGGGIGWAGLNSNNDSLASGSSTKSAFAWNMKGGTNIWFSKKVGLKLQAELISASAATGGAYFWSYYGPIYANTYTSIYQFSLGGGLVFRFGK